MELAGRTGVAVIGAGPYGLSLAAHLAKLGIRHRVFGKPMDTWRSNMPKGMYLKSVGRASSLSAPSGAHTLKAFCAGSGEDYHDWDLPVSIDQFIRYGDWFREEFVPGVDTRNIVACSRQGDGFGLQTDDGEKLTARTVVVSSGYLDSARVPEELAALPRGRVTHTSEHDNLDGFAGRRVAVIGAGQSALESAALLREAGSLPTLIARRREIDWGPPPGPEPSMFEEVRHPRGDIGVGWRYVFYEHNLTPFHCLSREARRRQVETILGPFGAYWLRERVEGQFPVWLGAELRGAAFDGGEVVLKIARDGETADLRVDHVLSGTGYQVRPQSFPFLSDGLRRQVRWDFGSPVLSWNFESSVPQLYFTGLASAYSFGPVMRFVAGAYVAIPRLARHIALHRAS